MTQAEFSQGMDLPHCSAYDAYHTLLKGLLLKEFPCGLGEWREDHQLIQSEISKARSKGIGHGTIKPNLTDFASSVTLKDVNPRTERIETLSELTKARESPWCESCDWTEEGGLLRGLAISEPWTLSQKRVNSLLRTLKVHDRNVGDIDKRIKQLSNLENLVLSANYLTWIDGQNLPQSLKALELHGNFIDDLAGLLPTPPPMLEHLGVGRNNLSFVGDHLTGIYWPCLLSLDLSFNHLGDLKELLEGLATLPKLRSLVLAGNPLSLTPWYRGYTIDHLKKLLSLDDVKVSADERHYYRGMVRRREFLQDQCLLQIQVDTLNNLPVPPEIAAPDDFPEYPLIVRKYCIRFWLPFEDDATPAEKVDEAAGKAADSNTDGLEGKLRKSTGFMSDIPEEPPAPDDGQNSTASQHGHGPEQPITRLIHGTACAPVCSSQRTYAELTNQGEAQGLIGWQGQIVRSNLRQMRDFLMHSVPVDIVENKSLMYPPDQLPQEGQETKTGQDKKKEEKKDDGKPKKKKKVDESSLVVHSTESTPLASISIDLSELLTSAGQKLKVELKSPAPAAPPTAPSSPVNADKKSKDNKTAAKDDKKKQADKGKGGSAKPSGGTNKKHSKDQTADVEDSADIKQLPPSVEAKAELLRVQWRSVKDCPTAVVIAVDH